MFKIHLIYILVLCITSSFSFAYAEDMQTSEEFILYMEKKYGFGKNELTSLLDSAVISKSILDAIRRPAEKKLRWYQYSKIFIKRERIEQGVKFWIDNDSKLREAEKKFGVPPEIITAIIGVETFYGRISGSYRVIDALTTLAFHYPRRATFFRSELEQFLLLSREQNFNPGELKGSYAGAMGMPQFISSSYRNYAIDFDGDNVVDIWDNPNDVIGSVANYFFKHGWRQNKSIISKVVVKGEKYKSILDDNLELNIKKSDLKALGIESNSKLQENERLRLFEYRFKDKSEYWLAQNNFYVITRYNHSKLYAMAVFQLAEKIKEYKNNDSDFIEN